MRNTALAAFLLIQFFATSANAVERVAKLADKGPGSFGVGAIKTNEQIVYPGTPGQELTDLTFTVYTQQETDARVTRDEKIVSEMQEMIRILRENMQKLSDLNDALTKRIDDLEKRLAEKQ